MKIKEAMKSVIKFIWKHKFEITTGALSLTLGFIFYEANKYYDIKGYATFPDKVIKDEEVYQFIKRHSTFFDRINAKKMTEMSLIGFTILSQDNPDEEVAGIGNNFADYLSGDKEKESYVNGMHSLW